MNSGVVTLEQVAKRAGVSRSTACDILRNRTGKVKVSDATRQRVMLAVKELDYQPLAAARALVTGRTFNIGFMISTRISLGLSNEYFSTLMSGVEMACRRRGYNCIIGVHDLSSMSTFVTPAKVRSHKVDGIVICGYVENKIIETIIEWGLPFILVGESTDFPREKILSAAENMVRTWQTAFGYLYSLGHRNIEVGGINSERAAAILNTSIEQFKKEIHADVSISQAKCDSRLDSCEQAFNHGLDWMKQNNKPTAIVAHAYWCLQFLSALSNSKFNCPGDVSVVSTTDLSPCKWYNPPITAYSTPLLENGAAIADLLVDFVEQKLPYSEAYQKANNIWIQGKLVERKSCRKI